ncbi:glutamate ligase domain-containing protein, partial [Pseudacidovorax intermedius]|uniref:glutamate ligase domain-containing protein n=1 Tax=Pseudacidovorax intermedius TaxID=433924 RepID=UPI0005B9FEB2
ALSCLPQEAATWVLELGQAPAPAMVQVARPQVLVLAVDPVEPGGGDMQRKMAQLVEAMPEDACVVLCRDMPGYDGLALLAARRGLRVFDHGSHRDAQVRLTALGHGELRAEVVGSPVRMKLQAVGAHVGLGATAVLATVLALEWQAQLGAALVALGGFERHEWRGPVLEVPIAGGSFHFVDETHDANPTSMRAALALLAQAPCAPRQRVAVLGEMQGLGAESQRHHLALQTEVLAAQPGRVLLCGPLMGPLAQRLKPLVPVRWFNDAAELVAAFGDIVAPGDWVLAKGGARIGLARLAKAVKAMA